MFAGSIASGQQYPFIPVPGAPSNIRTLFEDSRGSLWIGGDRLARFDGSRMFYLADYGFPNTTTSWITEDSSGAIWIGAETGVYRIADGRSQQIATGVVVSISVSTPDVVVAAVGPPGKGIPLNASLIRIQRANGEWKAETVMNLESPGPMTLDQHGRLLYPFLAGGWSELSLADVAGWRPGRRLSVTHHGMPDAIAPTAGPVKILRDRSGCVWVGSETAIVYDCGDNRWRYAPYENASMRANLSEGPDGSMVLAGYNLLAVGRPGSFQVADSANGLPQVTAALRARDGTIWLGNGQALYRFASPFRMEYWAARNGVSNPWALRRSGSTMYAGMDRTVAILSNDRRGWQSISSFRTVGQVVNLLPTADGNILAALNPGGAAMIDRNGKILARTVEPPSGSYGLRFARTSARDVWLGGLSLWRLTRDGVLLKRENHRFDTQPAGNVLDVEYEERTRKLWACYNGGLAVRNEQSTWREITTKDGLLVNACWSTLAGR